MQAGTHPETTVVDCRGIAVACPDFHWLEVKARALGEKCQLRRPSAEPVRPSQPRGTACSRMPSARFRRFRCSSRDCDIRAVRRESTSEKVAKHQGGEQQRRCNIASHAGGTATKEEPPPPEKALQQRKKTEETKKESTTDGDIQRGQVEGIREALSGWRDRRPAKHPREESAT